MKNIPDGCAQLLSSILVRLVFSGVAKGEIQNRLPINSSIAGKIATKSFRGVFCFFSLLTIIIPKMMKKRDAMANSWLQTVSNAKIDRVRVSFLFVSFFRNGRANRSTMIPRMFL